MPRIRVFYQSRYTDVPMTRVAQFFLEQGINPHRQEVVLSISRVFDYTVPEENLGQFEELLDAIPGVRMHLRV